MLDLSTWNLSIPTEPTPITITTQRLNNGYESRYFRRNADGSVTFWVPVTGSTTPDARYPRSELRETQHDGTLGNWLHASSDSYLSAVLQVDQVPSRNKVVLGHRGGYILNDVTKRTIKLLRKGGVYILRMWIQDGEKERLVEAVVDSGVEESVIGPGIFPGEVVPSAMSKSGRRYRAANGARIPNLGQLDVFFHTDVEDSVFHRPM